MLPTTDKSFLVLFFKKENLSFFVLLLSVLIAGGAAAAPFKTVYRFQGHDDGNRVFSNLLNQGGIFYGVTSQGGTSHNGTVFSFDPATGAKNVIYNVPGGKIGKYPSAPLTLHDSVLVATNSEGGSANCSYGCGTLFTVDPARQSGKLLYDFLGGTDGEAPNGGLVYARGAYFGTTLFGGGTDCNFGLGCGVLFKVDARSGAEHVVLRFASGRDGYEPVAGLTRHGDTLYGTTWLGGPHGNGAVFSFDLATGKETVLYGFAGGADGGGPSQPLLYADGTLYGATQWGGVSGDCEPVGSTGCGTVFAIDPATGAKTTLYAFQGFDDGAEPNALAYRHGVLFGTTAEGGGRSGDNCFENYGCGTVFSLNVQFGAEAVLFRFQPTRTGNNPYAGLTYWHDFFFGTTSGFSGGHGTIFRIRP